MSRRGWVLFGAMCVIWGMPYLFIRIAVHGIEPAVLVFLRTAMGATLLLPFALRRGRLTELLRHWRILVIYTFVEIGLPWFLLSDAERTISSSLAGLLIASVPLIGVALSRATGGDERFGGRRLLGLVIGITGVALLLGFNVSGGTVWAVVEMGVVAVCYAIGPLIISRRLQSLSPIGVVTFSLGIAAIVYAPIALTRLPATFPAADVIAAIVVLGVVATALAFVLFFALIAEVGPVRATVITYVNPAVAVALGVTVLGEPLSASIAGGFALILAGSFLATRRERVQQPAPAAATLDGVGAPLVEEQVAFSER
jgi:drug/metabolite transporter (DMT)-like permease